MLTVDKQHSNLMNYKTFIGADISKETIDFSIVQDGQELLHEKVLNDSKKIESFLKTLKKNQLLSEPVFCMEFTGIYNNILTLVLSKHQIPQVIESALNIKFSQGVQRGKDDRIDAKRIALYAFKNRDNLKLWSPTDQVLDDLKALVGLRKRIISNINRLKVPLGEAKFHSKETLKKMFACSKTSIEALKKDLARVDKLINSVIQENLDLKRSFDQITSVDGLGPMTAIMILICTGNFKKINDPKKFACYSGVAPFPHSSGKSLRGRSKVSHLANKSMKTLLHMASISAIQREGDIKEYYYRKVEEGKNKMLVLNAIRNKLIARAFACARENRCFEKKLQSMLV